MSACFISTVVLSLMGAHPWPTFQGDIQHTGQSLVNGPASSTLVWSFGLGGTASSSPVIAQDGTIYVGTGVGDLVAVKPDGAEKWRFPAGSPINATPVILDDGGICVGNSSGELVAVDPQGTERWRFQATGQFAASSAPIVDGSSIYVACDSILYCINASTGKEQWRFEASGSIDVCPGKSMGDIYVQTWWPPPHFLHSVSSSGVGQWQHQTGGGTSSPTIYKDKIILGSNDYYVYCIYETGSRDFRTLLSGKVSASPAVSSAAKILVGAWDSTFYCIDKDGALLWEFPTQGVIKSSAAVDASGNVYFGCSDRNFYSLSPQGEERWRFSASHQIISSPAIGQDGTVYFVSWDGTLYAVGPGACIEEQSIEGYYLEQNPVSVFSHNLGMLLNLSRPLATSAELDIVDITGRTAFSTNLDKGTQTVHCQVENLHGVFLVILKTSQFREVRRVLLL